MLNNGPASGESCSPLGHGADDQIRPIRPSQAERLRLAQGETRQDNPASADLVDFEHFVFSFPLMYYYSMILFSCQVKF